MCTHCGQPPLSISCTKGPTCVQPHGPTEDPIKQVQVHYTVALVYARYMRGVVWYTHGIRSYTLVYAGGCGLISAAQNRRFQGDTLYTAGMLCPHHAIHWKGTSIQSTCYSCGCYTRKSNKNMIQGSFQSVVKDLPMFHGTWLRTDAASILI